MAGRFVMLPTAISGAPCKIELTTAKGHPAVKASPDDVKSLVKWVLSQ